MLRKIGEVLLNKIISFVNEKNFLLYKILVNYYKELLVFKEVIINIIVLLNCVNKYKVVLC